jgi:hypothetical protein
MATPIFKFVKSISGGKPMTIQAEMAPSVTLADGAPCEFDANSKVNLINAVADSVLLIKNGEESSSAEGGETGMFLHAMPNDGIWKCKFTPLIDDIIGQSSGATTKKANLTAFTHEAYAAGDELLGGTLWCKESAQARNATRHDFLQENNQKHLKITSNDISAQDAALVVEWTTPLHASSSGLTFRGTPLGPKHTAVKFKSDFSAPSQTLADLTGGKIRIIDVDLENKEVYVMFI